MVNLRAISSQNIKIDFSENNVPGVLIFEIKKIISTSWFLNVLNNNIEFA